MAAPIQFNDPQRSGIGLYYVPPTDVPNIAAEFLANYTRTRLPWAQQVFSQRLAALDPNARYALVEKLIDDKNKLIEQAATDRRNAARISADQGIEASRALGILVKAQVDVRGQNTQMAVANTEANTAQIEARQVHSAAAKAIVNDITAATQAAGVALSRLAPDDQAGMDAVLTDYNSRLANSRREMERQQLAAGEKDAIRDQASGLQIPIGGPGGNALSAGLGTYFAPAAQMESRTFGPGATPDIQGASQAAIEFALQARSAGGGAPSPPPDLSLGQTSRTGPPLSTPATGRAASTGAPTPAVESGGGGSEYANQARRIDDLINKIQEDARTNPFGDLGGFTDPLLGLGKNRPVDKAGAADIARRRPKKFNRIAQELGRADAVPAPTAPPPALRKPSASDIDPLLEQLLPGSTKDLGETTEPAKPPTGKPATKTAEPFPWGQSEPSRHAPPDNQAMSDEIRATVEKLRAEGPPPRDLVPAAEPFPADLINGDRYTTPPGREHTSPTMRKEAPPAPAPKEAPAASASPAEKEAAFRADQARRQAEPFDASTIPGLDAGVENFNALIDKLYGVETEDERRRRLAARSAAR